MVRKALSLEQFKERRRKHRDVVINKLNRRPTRKDLRKFRKNEIKAFRDYYKRHNLGTIKRDSVIFNEVDEAWKTIRNTIFPPPKPLPKPPPKPLPKQRPKPLPKPPQLKRKTDPLPELLDKSYEKIPSFKGTVSNDLLGNTTLKKKYEKFILKEGAFQGSLENFRLAPRAVEEQDDIDFDADRDIIFHQSIDLTITDIAEFLSKYKLTHKNFRFQIVITCSFYNPDKDEHRESSLMQTKLFESDKYDVSEIHKSILSTYDWAAMRLKGSDFVYEKIVDLLISCNNYEKHRGSSYIKLPAVLTNKKAIVNIKNEDNKCFLWCVLCHLYLYDNDIPENKKNNLDRVAKYEEYLKTPKIQSMDFSELDFDGIKSVENKKGSSAEQVCKFAKKNNLYIRVLAADVIDGEVSYTSLVEPHSDEMEEVPDERKILILLYKNHYVYVKTPNRLFKTKHFYCFNCGVSYPYEKKDDIERHKRTGCKTKNVLKCFPKEGENYVEFNKPEHLFWNPFVIYADFESYLVPENEKCAVCGKTKNEASVIENDCRECLSKNTWSYQNHKPCSWGYKVICDEKVKEYLEKRFENIDPADKETKKLAKDFNYLMKYREYNLRKTYNEYAQPEKDFISSLRHDGKIIEKFMRMNTPIEMTNADEIDFELAEKCYLCNCIFTSETIKNRDHCHITGRYRGAACTKCNLAMKWDGNINIFFHNLSGYDSHFVVRGMIAFNKYLREEYYPQIGKEGTNTVKIGAINKTDERCICLTFGQQYNFGNNSKRSGFGLLFKDSWLFMSMPLANAAKLLKYNEFKHTIEYWTQKGKTQEEITKLISKGVFPYDWWTGSEKLDKPYPPIDAFYSKLKKTGLAEKDYIHGKEVYEMYGCKNMGEYCSLYQLTDILILADVFEGFRKKNYEIFGIDIVNHYTFPGCAWEALLKMTGEKIELISEENREIYEILLSQIRGGMCNTFTRHAKANNKYVTNYDPSKPTTYIIHLDATSLYASCMFQKMPIDNLRFLKGAEKDAVCSEEFIKKYDFGLERMTKDDSDINNLPVTEGYFYLIDLEIPEELHDYFKDYPLAPENMSVSRDDLTVYQISCLGVTKYRDSGDKLMQTLNNKKIYLVHIALLQVYVKLGLRITKYHDIIAFNQKAWMRRFIKTNIVNRNAAKASGDALGDAANKLANNSTYGKTIENIEKRGFRKLISSKREFDYIARSIRYLGNPIIYDEELVLCSVKPNKIKIDKPIQIGLAILDISKAIMYNFFYFVILKAYGRDKVRNLYTDTDSLIMEIQTEDFYEDLKNIPVLKDNISGDLCCFKDECGAGTYIDEFVGLSSKVYCYKTTKLDTDGNVVFAEKKGMKGTDAETQKKITFDRFRDVLFRKKLETTCTGDESLHYVEERDTIKYYADINRINSKKHDIKTITMQKVVLGDFNDKMLYFGPNDFLPHGHKDAIRRLRSVDQTVEDSS